MIQNKIHVGSVRSTANYQYLASGIVLMIVATPLLIISGMKKYPLDPLDLVILSFGVLLALIGLLLIFYSFKIFPHTMYVKDGKCVIVDRKIHCYGGCNKCHIARTYLDQINQGDEDDK